MLSIATHRMASWTTNMMTMNCSPRFSVQRGSSRASRACGFLHVRRRTSFQATPDQPFGDFAAASSSLAQHDGQVSPDFPTARWAKFSHAISE